MHRTTQPVWWIFGVFLVGIIGIFFLARVVFTTTIITLCDVGQGLAVHIRGLGSIDVLYDTGPSAKKITQCLADSMPFYDKTIELLIISHNDLDHVGGVRSVIEKYRINLLSGLSDEIYNSFSPSVQKRVGDRITLLAGDSVSFFDARISIVWPHKPSHNIDTNRNEFSTVVYYKEKTFSLLLPGDISAKTFSSFKKIPPVSILVVPHHGSAYGLTTEIIDILKPKIALVSAGKNNTYGHPASSIIQKLTAKKILLFRSDVNRTAKFYIAPDYRSIVTSLGSTVSLDTQTLPH